MAQTISSKSDPPAAMGASNIGLGPSVWPPATNAVATAPKLTIPAMSAPAMICIVRSAAPLSVGGDGGISRSSRGLLLRSDVDTLTHETAGENARFPARLLPGLPRIGEPWGMPDSNAVAQSLTMPLASR